MAGKPQSLSKGQQEEVANIVRKKIWNIFSVSALVLTVVFGTSIWSIIKYSETILKNRINAQFEKPRIKAVVEEVASERAETLLMEQIYPEVDRFKKETDLNIEEIESLVDDARSTIVGLNSDFLKINKGMLDITYFTYKGRNQFPNPYDDRIMKTLNDLLIIAIPDQNERTQFISEITTYEPNENNKPR